MTGVGQFAMALPQNCQGFPKVSAGGVAFKEGRVSYLPRLNKVMKRQIKVSQARAQPNRD